jgi:hypothetical protein
MSAGVRSGGGWVLLEMLLALTIFVFTAVAILGAVSQGIAGAERTRDRARAVDVARSTMARLEAGLGPVQSLSGPVPPWEPPPGDGAESESIADVDGPPAQALWEVEIDTEPSDFPGLTHVTVTALKRPVPESERVAASYSLHQLVRLGPEIRDSVGALDAIGAAGAASPGASP